LASCRGSLCGIAEMLCWNIYNGLIGLLAIDAR
jgi:hypothetical protein